MAYSIDFINTICTDLGGSGGHEYEIDGLNEICTLLSATAGHTYSIDALNAICTALGYTAGWEYDIDALNTIVVGGTYQYEDEAWSDIQVGSKLNPIPAYSLATMWLDGTIVDSSGSYYFKNKKGDNVLITGYDFQAGWSKGFPYKSAATIDVFGQTGVPVTSLFQNFDYANQYFTRHVAQVVDGNGVETSEAYVCDIVAYSEALTGDNLTKANTYFNPPAKVVNNVKWIDSVNGSDSAPNDGTESKPYATFAKAVAGVTTTGTIYGKTSVLSELCQMTNKGISVLGVGLLKTTRSGAQFLVANNNTDAILFKGIYFSGYISLGASAAVITVESCFNAANLLNATAANNVDFVVKNSILKQIISANSPTTKLQSNYILPASGVIPLTLIKNLESKNNRYNATVSGTTLIKRAAATTVISFLGDYVKGSLLTDEAIATETAISLVSCNLNPNASGAFISLVNAASKVTLSIIYSTITQVVTGSTTAFSFKGYGFTFNNNSVLNENGTIINIAALAAAKDAQIKDNNFISIYAQDVVITDYISDISNNIINSDVWSRLIITSINQSSIPVTINNNKLTAKAGGAPFVLLGTEYNLIIDSRLNGSVVSNNRLRGPADFGNAVGSTHALFVWSQQADWKYNFVSGSFLTFVFKSNGGTFANAVHHNIINNNSQAFTIKGIKGTLIYNNTIVNSLFYNGLSETYVGATGDSGNSICKNNIVVDTIHTTHLIDIEDTTDLIGCEFDYNLYYCPNAAKFAKVGATQYTFAEWQALGYDAHSIMLTEAQFNALFTDYANGDYSLKVGSAAIGAGVALDAAYDDGLDASTDWGNDSELPVVVTKQQGAAWDCGAYIH